MKITVLGSGTSSGVPTIGCKCAVCTSPDPRDNRLRPSILISHSGRNILIDTTPDFRAQALRARIERVDAILFTHAHADHIMGLDDVRPFNFRQKSRIPIYGAPDTLASIRRAFPYVFESCDLRTMIPQLDLHEIDGGPFQLLGLHVDPIPLLHGRQTIFGYRFGRAAYLTDHSAIPEASMDKLRDLDVLFLDALRHAPHPTHSTVALSVENARSLAPRRAYLTHICHDLGHVKTESSLPANVFLAYDGLEIEIEEDPA